MAHLSDKCVPFVSFSFDVHSPSNTPPPSLSEYGPLSVYVNSAHLLSKFVHQLTSSLSLSSLPTTPYSLSHDRTFAFDHTHTHTAVYWRFSACVCYMVGAACLSVPLLFLLLVTPKLSDKKQ